MPSATALTSTLRLAPPDLTRIDHEPNKFSLTSRCAEAFVYCVGVAVARSSLERRRADLPHLSPDDPTAKALGYTKMPRRSTARKFPTYAASQKCSTCLQFQGKAGDAYRALQYLRGQAGQRQRLVPGLGEEDLRRL